MRGDAMAVYPRYDGTMRRKAPLFTLASDPVVCAVLYIALEFWS